MNLTSARSSPKREFLTAGIFIAIGLLAFAPSITVPFLSDDYYALIVFKNQGLRAFYDLHDRTFIPFTLAVMGVIYKVFGASAVAFRVFSIAIHSLNAWLLFLLLRRLFTIAGKGDKGLFRSACAGGLFFLVLPFQAEAVVWIAAMAYPLCIFCCLVAIHFFISYRFRSRPSSLLFSLLAFLCAVLAKELAIVLPLIIVAMDWLMFRRRKVFEITTAGVLRAFCFFLVIVLGYMVMRRFAVGEWVGMYGSGVHTSFHLTLVVKAMLAYAANFIVLFRFWIGFIGGSSGGHNYVLMLTAAFIVLLSCGLFIFMIRKNIRSRSGESTFYPSLFFFMISCLIALLPVINLETTFLTQIQSERYGYFASLFFCAALAVFLHIVFRKQRLRFVLSALLLCVYIFLLESDILKFRNAGRLAQKVLYQTEALAAGPGRYVVLNIPDTRDGVYVFRNGLAEAIMMNSGRRDNIFLLTYNTAEADAEPVISRMYSDTISVSSTSSHTKVFADPDAFPSGCAQLLRSTGSLVILKVDTTSPCRYYSVDLSGELNEIKKAR